MDEQNKVPVRITDLAFARFAAYELHETDHSAFDELDFAVVQGEETVEVSAEVAKYAFLMARKYGMKHRADHRYDIGHAVGSSIRMACVPRGIYPG